MPAQAVDNPPTLHPPDALRDIVLPRSHDAHVLDLKGTQRTRNGAHRHWTARAHQHDSHLQGTGWGLRSLTWERRAAHGSSCAIPDAAVSELVSSVAGSARRAQHMRFGCCVTAGVRGLQHMAVAGRAQLPPGSCDIIIIVASLPPLCVWLGYIHRQLPASSDDPSARRAG